MAAESLPMTAMLRPGSRERRLIDWCLTSAEAVERQVVQMLLSGDDAAFIPYLKELLCQPFLRHDVRQWALVRLAEIGCREEMLILAGDHYTLIACQKVEESGKPSSWASFLGALLTETRRYGQSSEIAQMAAALWKCMNDHERAHAGSAGQSLWCKAVEIYFLCMQGADAVALRAMEDAAQPQRRIRRILRRIHRYMTKSSRPAPEKEIQHEVH